MAGQGPPPKPHRVRSRAEKPTKTLIVADSTSAPPMPAGAWLPQTREWWGVWVGSEQAAHFTATSWQRLTMLVPLVDLYWREPSRNTLAEIRMNESKLGATPEDLQRLRWKIEKPPPATSTKGMFDQIMRPVE
jgi:hypothetical protein